MRTEAKWYGDISIHSLVKRETDILSGMPVFGIRISIHSLVKRETQTAIAVISGLRDFNPLPRKEGDATLFRWCQQDIQFQSTPS